MSPTHCSDVFERKSLFSLVRAILWHFENVVLLFYCAWFTLQISHLCEGHSGLPQ